MDYEVDNINDVLMLGWAGMNYEFWNIVITNIGSFDIIHYVGPCYIYVCNGKIEIKYVLFMEGFVLTVEY